ncbi:MAG: hypothetical protein OXD44_10295 [Gammaproteobacteria bacterium]|nr:hypothetical protein [Gammaproteobacteria bacterium]
MIIDEFFDRCLERIRTKAIVVPPLDGAMRPNNLLDESEVILGGIKCPDNAIVINDELWFSSKNQLFKLNVDARSDPQLIEGFEADISCMAASPDKGIAIGLEDARLLTGRTEGQALVDLVDHEALGCPSAMTFSSDGRLLVCQGSKNIENPADMTRDLMQHGRSGSVWTHDFATGERSCIARNLGYPYGIVALSHSDEILVSECWQHRIIKLSLQGNRKPEAVFNDIPGYPARMIELSNSGLMLCLFAPRNRLIEFVLRAHEFRKQMIDTIDPAYWIAPTLKSTQNFLAPLQQGGVKVMGIHKPWAPSLSHGMMVRLDQSQSPVESYHSRANGQRHGITSCCQIGHRIFATSKGDDCIIELSMNPGGQA